MRSVAEAQGGFRPARRTKEQEIALEDGLGRVASRSITSPHDLPGFARSAVDGYAVRAADTFGASATLPMAFEVVGEVEMGGSAPLKVEGGAAAAIPTGGALPEGADAVVMVERTSRTDAGSVEVLEAVAVGQAVVRPDEDVAKSVELVAAGRAIRPEHLGLLAAAGVTSLSVFARPAGGDPLDRRRARAAEHHGARPGTGSRCDRWCTSRPRSPRRRGARPARDRAGRPGTPARSARGRARRQRRRRRLGRLLCRHARRHRRRDQRAWRPRDLGVTVSPSSRASRRCSRSAQECP